MSELEELYDLAKLVAISGGEKALKYFRKKNVKVKNKEVCGFDPVTTADFESERIMREIIEKERPNDSIVGEEFENKKGDNNYEWVLDPIDGTRAFIAGIPVWGVLVALNKGKKPIIGVIYQPFSKELYSGKDHFSELKMKNFSAVLKTSEVFKLKNAIISTTFPEFDNEEERKIFNNIKSRTKFVRYGLDCYAYALLAQGKIDIIMESGLKKYDIQAPHVIVEGAGGIITNWKGDKAYEGGTVLASSNSNLHQKILKIISETDFK